MAHFKVVDPLSAPFDQVLKPVHTGNRQHDVRFHHREPCLSRFGGSLRKSQISKNSLFRRHGTPPHKISKIFSECFALGCRTVLIAAIFTPTSQMSSRCIQPSGIPNESPAPV